ncbi:MAG: rRNA maturation RNase YbeY [Acidobacteria bacterium]|nr:rRNA maturation RNase YbeY [Acidobacteriota bacterium]
MTELYNLQRKVNLDVRPLRTFAEGLAEHVHEAFGSSFATALISDRRMRELNSLFRGKSETTDVLSFPANRESFESQPANNGDDHFLGDVVISAEQAKRQSRSNKLSLEREIKQLILHGLLHLCGYDHERDNGEMNSRELELRKKLKI